MRPSYNTQPEPDRDYILLLNTINNKEEYCSIIQSSLCTITTDFYETFGCVFAESYYLNTPVILSDKISAIHEFLNNDHMCNLDNYDSFEARLLEFYENRPLVYLKSSFMDNESLNCWIEYLNSNYQ
jgi:glycosyltransferase involved in cell wall biosynthesis